MNFSESVIVRGLTHRFYQTISWI